MMEVKENKVCFIICTNNELILNECLTYLSLLDVPEGIETQLLIITDAKSMTSGYNEGMQASDAKYKVYLHQDTFILNRNFIADLLEVFAADPQIGLVGMIGAERLAQDGIMWHEKRCGNCLYLDELIAQGVDEIEKVDQEIKEVQVVDGLLMATQYDLTWREDIFKAWDFYDVSQCLEFRRRGYKVVVPPQKTSWVNHKCGAPSLWKYDESRQIALKEYPEISWGAGKYRFLFVGANLIAINGLAVGLVLAGHSVKISNIRPSFVSQDPKIVEALEESIESGNYDFVISYDFCPAIAIACHTMNTKYLAWVYDSPQYELYKEEALFDTNYFMLFDKKQVERMKNRGLSNIYYGTLATDVERFGSLKLYEEDEKKYGSEVSFVGRLYNRRDFDALFEGEPEQRKEVDAIMESCFCKWEEGVTIFGKSSGNLVDFIQRKDPLTGWMKEVFTDEYYTESFVLTRMLNQMERTKVLNVLGERYQVALYTDDKVINGLRNVDIRGPVKYAQEMPKVFYYTKINLNITSRCIESGIPQRIFDIMAVGGFVLTNYQPEIEDYFIVGEEIEVFHNLEELRTKTAYYLKHEERRREVAMNGYSKVCKLYSYTVRVDEVIKKIMEENT